MMTNQQQGQSQGWRNRIVGSGEKPASEFLSNPFNFRVHTALQTRALSGSLDSLGWIDDVIVNRKTGHLIDGHLRIALALAHKQTVPYKEVDLSPDEELQALLSLDPIAAMAGQDSSILETVLEQIESEDERVLEFLETLRDKSMADPLPQEERESEKEAPLHHCANCGHEWGDE
jgi:hypothetical protein